ncbi:hypothetical protein DF186_15385, partial [Enterococcus hirae]
PAQFFHMIRRQMKRSLRLPVIVMTPKSLLRHKLSVSELSALSDQGFLPIIDEPGEIDPEKVERVVFCSGKVYYDLVEARDAQKIKDVHILRL